MFEDGEEVSMMSKSDLLIDCVTSILKSDLIHSLQPFEQLLQAHGMCPSFHQVEYESFVLNLESVHESYVEYNF